MSKFNQKAKPEMVATHEGGAAYAKSVEMEWTNMLFSSFLSGGFYENENDQLSRFDALTDEMVKKYGAVFAAKVNPTMYCRRSMILSVMGDKVTSNC